MTEQSASGWSKAARRRTARRPRTTSSVSPPCDNCGAAAGAYGRVDSSGVPGRVCGECQWLSQDELLFG